VARSCTLTVGLLIAASALAQDVFQNVERVVAVGDVHGDLEALTSVLRSSGIIDQRGRWMAGKTHLVQNGDLLDRGPQSRKVLDLFMRLEKEASRAGGKVHCLIGNHEAMNIYGDLRYAIPEDFAAFRTSDSEQVRRHFWEEHVKTLRANPDAAYRKQWEEEHPLGWFEHRYEFSPQGRYGKWIQSHPTMVKINDSLFVHGGLSPKYAAMSIAEINNAVRARLNGSVKLEEGDIVTGDDGPLWYRGLTKDSAEVTQEYVDQLLETHGVKRIVIGHTPTPGAVLTRFGGKVVLIDVGLSAYYGSRHACLILEPARRAALHRGARVDLPADEGKDLLRYLRAVAAVDPQPSPLDAFVNDMAKRLVMFSDAAGQPAK
jgi:hypothetical protein